MRKLRLTMTALLLCSLILFSNILTNDIRVAQAATSARLSDKTLVLELGHYKTLKIYGTTNKAAWSSSNTWIATVSSSGKVTAKAVGTAYITARVNGQKLTCKLTVLRIKKSLTLTPQTTGTLTISGTKSTAAWSSGDTSIATVSDTGLITAIAPGVTTITATVDGKELTGTVYVADINHKSYVMELGGFSGYTLFLKTLNTTGKAIWTTSDPSVATVSDNGKVSAKGAGSVTITATVDGVVLTSNIKVLAENTRAFTLKMGETKKLEIYGTDSTITWHSNKQSVALVTDDGTVSTVAPGTAIIMAYVDGRNVMAKVTVTE